jgi:hypothetical protein
MFKPFGNLVRLPDGRTLQKQTTGGWIDVNSGVKMNDTMVGNLMYSSAFYGVPDGGVGKNTPRWVIGVAGSITVTNWLNDARSGTDSIDMVFIGDSNVGSNFDVSSAFEAQALVDNFVLAGICSGIRMYGSPVQPMGGNGVNPFNSLGYKIFTTSFKTDTFNLNGFTSGIQNGPSLFANEYGIGSGALSQCGITVAQICGYAYLPSGLCGFANSSNGSVWSLGNTAGITGLDPRNAFYTRVIIGATNANQTGGKFNLYGEGYTGTRYLNTSIQITGGFTAYEIDCTESDSIRSSKDYQFYYGLNASPGFACTGPIAIAKASFFNKVKGMAASALAHMPGYSLGAIYTSLTQAGASGGNNTVVNYMKEYYNRQVSAGGSGRVCFVINGGVNVDSSASATVDYEKNIVSFLTSEWSRAGLPSDKITFLCTNTWESLPSSTWSTNLPGIANDMNSYARTSPNVTYVNMLKLGGTYAGLTAAGYYYDGAAVHLTRAGYKYISQNIIDALLKSGRNTFKG